MKTLFVSSLIWCKLLGSLPLLDDYHKAKEIAALYEKPLVLIFTAEESSAIIEDVVCNESFIKSIENEFVFVKIDLTARKNEILEHHRIKEKLSVSTYPTLVLLDSSEREITRFGYKGQTPEKFASFLKNRLATYHELSIESEKCSDVENLEILYEKANELGSQYYKDKILGKGIELQEGVFFPMEQYISLVNKGAKSSLEAEGFREIILKRDQDNKRGTRLRLALLDFQEGEGSPEQVVAPLVAYIKDFGPADNDNLWKLRLIITEYLNAQGREDLANEYSKKSHLETALLRVN